ncbi:MAG: DUF434 domain-containing protein [Myxococcales bacterium]|jgi:hypothetical protein|nr:DUF434 domain-containing protein [Myxococcales bacterium]
MPDSRTHRGPHPRDPASFAPRHVPALRAATEDLSWLLSRGYNTTSALALTGDRYGLTARQRMAVSRAACSEEARRRREASRIETLTVRGTSAADGDELWVDGFNVLLTLEVALGGGPVFVARDGCLRDIASVHGTYRKVHETAPAVRLLTDELQGLGARRVTVLLDAPVSNSGRLASVIRGEWAARGLCRLEDGGPADVRVPANGEPADARGPADVRGAAGWRVLLVNDPDAELVREGRIVASADGAVLDGAAAWINLARRIVDARVPGAFRVDLSDEAAPGGGAEGIRRGGDQRIEPGA